MALDILRHPCFNDAARHTLRPHPPAGGAGVQHPVQLLQADVRLRQREPAGRDQRRAHAAAGPAVTWRACSKQDPRIAVVGIAGPGDPFATPERTLETLRLVRERHPEMLLCVASNGLGRGAATSDDLAALEVSHVTLTVNAVDPEIGAKVYAWVRDGKRIYRGPAGAELLWDRQAEAIRALKQRGVTVKINTIIIPGVNDEHVPRSPGGWPSWGPTSPTACRSIR